MYDVVLLTDSRYLKDQYPDQYSMNVITEDKYVQDALNSLGLKTWKTNWDNPDFDWSETKYILFRTTWDYFERFEEFTGWLETVSAKTKMINPYSLIKWSLDKHYLGALKERGADIVPTVYVEAGDPRSLQECIVETGWNKVVIKPTFAAAARHTYKIDLQNAEEHEKIFTELISSESMMIQPYIESIVSKGEVSHMIMGGEYTHSILKKAKKGDFRVQDDFGGTVHDYTATEEERRFAENVISKINPSPAYGRVDVIWDNNGKLAVSELELIEPELWFRNNPASAKILAKAVAKIVNE